MHRRLNVIALISGGKDSFYSLLHCLANGHNVVALANVFPPVPEGPPAAEEEEEEADLNSFMYQTVGHPLVPLYQDALALPLYRQQIVGSAVNTQLEYHVPAGNGPGSKSAPLPTTAVVQAETDETESLYTLLRRVKAAHPSADAVSSGAILSTYQRTRVESVAVRLGLVPLAYLWQYPELPTPVARKGGLLEDMAAVGLDARIVKVASGGLKEDLLWENVCDKATQKQLEKDCNMFGGSVLGEGGEYETFVVDGPSDVWKKRLYLRDGWKKVVRGGGGECWLAFHDGDTTFKQGAPDTGKWVEKLKKPELWDLAFLGILQEFNKEAQGGENLLGSHDRPTQVRKENGIQRCICRGARSLKISNMTASDVHAEADVQMVEIMNSLVKVLNQTGGSIDNISFVTLLLDTMNNFQTVNEIYAQQFQRRSLPPARITVACGNSLPIGVKVMASFVVESYHDQSRKGLHVQSRSYWAPANIGPYSQAIAAPLGKKREASLIYVAGQIPLVPSTMEVVEREPSNGHINRLSNFQLQTSLALQHLWRVGKAKKVEWWTGAIAYIATGNESMETKVKVASSAWKLIHKEPTQSDQCLSDGDEFDVWDQKNREVSKALAQEEVNLPNFECVSTAARHKAEVEPSVPSCPAFFAVEVDELPRNCMIEWQAVGVAKTQIRLDTVPYVDHRTALVCSYDNDCCNNTYIGVPLGDNGEQDLLITSSCLDLIHDRLGYHGANEAHTTIYTTQELVPRLTGAQVIPCKSVWSAEREKLAAAIVIEHEGGESEPIDR
ncbi:MAG: hypothetical protein LQ342_007319 [Letrouitia transgressa]|nr:MAG: hypothetical protein LQ342_007319 [Letrouitia transgressa]